jgi:hypothetical protein
MNDTIHCILARPNVWQTLTDRDVGWLLFLSRWMKPGIELELNLPETWHGCPRPEDADLICWSLASIVEFRVADGKRFITLIDWRTSTD